MKHAFLLALALASCGTPEHPETPASTSPAAPSPAAPSPAPAASARPDVELHEWGLVDATLRDTSIDVGTGPGAAPDVPRPLRKPVLYAHLREGLDEATISLGVRLPGGRVLEHWPAGELHEDALRWPAVTVRRGACAQPDEVTASRDAPAREPVPTRACDAPDGFCERFELPSYRTDDHDCLEVSGAPASLLFYRGTVPASALPIEITRLFDGTLTLRARRSMQGAPGAVLRVLETPEGVNVGRVALPGVGQSVSIAVPTTPIAAADEHRALERDLRALGLTASEADAFLRAWASTLYAGPSASGHRSARAPEARDIVLYWLPEDAVSALAELDLPATVRVRRAILVRIDVMP